MEHFKVTKEFMSGFFEGTVINEITDVPYEEGEVYNSIWGGSTYKILRVEPHFYHCPYCGGDGWIQNDENPHQIRKCSVCN